jgi:hypothetical protein
MLLHLISLILKIRLAGLIVSILIWGSGGVKRAFHTTAVPGRLAQINACLGPRSVLYCDYRVNSCQPDHRLRQPLAALAVDFGHQIADLEYETPYIEQIAIKITFFMSPVLKN